MTVSFKEPEQADSCISTMNGRWFAKRQISAEHWDGKTKYEIQESEAERNERLSKWEQYLESDKEKGKDSLGRLAVIPSSSEAAGAASVSRTETGTGVSTATADDIRQADDTTADDSTSGAQGDQ
jgi:hypothetical protein